MYSTHKIGAIALSVALTTLLGCTPSPRPWADVPHNAPSGGQTLSTALRSIESLPGIVVEDLAGGGRPNIKGNTGYNITIRVLPGYQIPRGPAFVTFVVETLWSVRDRYLPNADVTITVRDAPTSTFDVSIAAFQAGWIEEGEGRRTDQGYSSASITTSEGSPARTRLGKWPGDAPAVPEDLTQKK